MRRNIGILFIIIGMLTISWAGWAKYQVYSNQKKSITAFEDTLQQLEDTDSSGDKEIATKSDTLAVMSIDKIDLEVAVVEDVTVDKLKFAVGHFPGTALPGEKGNFSVAGHRSYTYGQYFNRLDELENGDEIKVKGLEGEFTYIVYDKMVVLPTETSVLDQTEDSELTLVTCTPIRSATHRLIVKAKLK